MSRVEWRVLVADDEPTARRGVRQLLAPFADFVVVGECRNGEEVLASLDTLRPDVVFLDIQMPGGTGFDLLARLENVPRVIFTTAYDHHAVHAFEVNALDYLLKPIEPERLAAAIARARTTKPGNPTAEPTGPALERLFVRDGSRCWFVPLREVSLMVSEGNYVRLHWGTSRPLLARALTSLEQRLDPGRYFRANRSQIINLDFIESIEPGAGGQLYAQLRDGPEIEISRRQARLFRMLTTV